MVKDNFLAIMAKEPAARKVKTRMSPTFSSVEAAALYECLLMDTIDLVKNLDFTKKVLAYTPREAEVYFRGIVPDGFQLMPQPPGDLGRRLISIARRLFNLGAKAICLMNSDSPDLPSDYIRRAFHLLHSGFDVVFGPSLDGGYYLVALRRPEDIFSNVPWSSRAVLEVSRKKAKKLNMKDVLLQAWTDLDTPDDLRRAFNLWRSGKVKPPTRSYHMAERLFSS
jgi:rSAM/selenodomain-associated transferase 1